MEHSGERCWRSVHVVLGKHRCGSTKSSAFSRPDPVQRNDGDEATCHSTDGDGGEADPSKPVSIRKLWLDGATQPSHPDQPAAVCCRKCCGEEIPRTWWTRPARLGSRRVAPKCTL